MSRTAVVMSLVAAVAIFSCGYITAKLQNAGAEVAEVAEVQKRDTQRADAKDENLANLRGAERVFMDGVYDDTTETDKLLYRVLRVTDGMRAESGSDSTADQADLAAALRRAKAREDRLLRALRIALDGNREDARRANEVTRLYNLCLTQAQLDRQQLAQAQR
mgnify:FL=1